MDAVLIILVGVILAALGQVSWKLGMNQAGQLSILDLASLSAILLNPLVVFGFIMYGLSTILWLIALSKRDLSYVYPFMALTYVLVLLLSSLLLKEQIGGEKAIGTLIIIIGLIIIART